jgi:hypothetical protein
MIRIVAIALLLIPATSHAASTVYTNRALFESNFTTLVVDDYEDPGYAFNQTDAGMSAVLNETKYTTTGFQDNNLVFIQSGGNHVYCAGCNGSYLLDFITTSVSDGVGVEGVGFDFINGGLPLYSAFVEFGDGTTANFSLPQALNPLFFGIVSDNMIATIHLGLSNGGTTKGGTFTQDNLTVGRMVPEPTSIILAAGSLLLLGRRR